MQALSIPDLECRFYDYSQAAAYFKEIGCKNDPQLGILEYHSGSETFRTIGWCSEENDMYQDVPAFKSFEDSEEFEKVIFVPMDEHEVFLIDGRLYITVSVAGGLGIRRINLLFDESIINALNSIRGMPDMEYKLCKIYSIERERQLLGYYWVGRWDAETETEIPYMIIAPVFGGEENILNTHNISELDIVEVEPKETIIKNATLWQVTRSEQYGITLIRIMEIYSGEASGMSMLN